MLLRNTVLELNDSLIEKGLVKIDLDADVLTDTTAKIGVGRMFQMKVDSSAEIIFSSKVHGEPPHRKNIMVRFHYDSLDNELLSKRYQIELSKAGLDLPVHLIMIDEFSNDGPVLFSEDVVRTPRGAFKLEFSDINWLIVKKIGPQVLFSIFLTCLVIGSFYLLYRNLRLQQRLVSIKDGLISNISHELKTPITTVGVALEGLRNFKGQNNPEVTSEYITIAEHELKRLSMLTEKVLHSSLADQNSMKSNFHSFDFGELIEEVKKSFKLIAERNNASIEIDKSSENTWINGDRDHLSTVLFNLIDNALKYSPEGAKIHITLTQDLNGLICTIEDKGIGIPKEYHRRIFEKFFRVPTGDLHPVKGYGLGLSYVHQIITRHGGSIDLQSEPGSGSTFIIRLPR